MWKNKLFCNLNFKMGSMWMVRIWVYEAYLFSRYYFNIKGQRSCNSFTNYKVTALKTERPGLENGKFHNILEWDPMWDRWAGPVFSEVQDTWQCLHRCTNTQNSSINRWDQWVATVNLKCCAHSWLFYILITHFIHILKKGKWQKRKNWVSAQL